MKISVSLRGEKNPMFGKHLSEETKRKVRSSEYHRNLKGENNPFFGKHHTEEAKKKIGEGNRGKHPSEEARQKMSESQKGRKHSEETKKKISEGQKGKKHSDETKKRMSEAGKGNKNSLGTHPSEETRQKLCETTKKNWQDPDFIKKVFDGLNMKPNELEKTVATILQKHLPDEYAYNGDFSCGITIGGKIPDFVNVNGKKVVIEVFGPWHDEVFMRDRFGKDISWKRTEFGTKAHYSQFGYKCVVLWQEELESNDAEQFILEKMKKEGAV